MARWIVMRHAKTEGALADDQARRLVAEGRDAARRQGQWLARHGWVPDRVVVSPAVRARQTVDEAAHTFPDGIPVDVVEPLYGGDVETYIEALEAAPGETVMLVAHDPTCTHLVARLAPDAPTRDGKTMPTGTVACFEDRRLAHLHWP